MLDVCLLGTGGMMPMPNRYLTSLLVRYNGRMVLVDCGEGTQVTMKLLGWGYKAIDCICFTHYHADHISGLPGLLLAISNSERKEPLMLMGPPDLTRIVKGLLVIAPDLGFDIRLMELPKAESREIPVPLTEFFVSTTPLNHGKPCLAYKIETKRGAKFDVERASRLDLPKMYWGRLQKGENVKYEGREYTPDMVLEGARKGFSICYATDTRPVKTLPDFIRGADLFVCEGLYGNPEMTEKTREHMHMTYKEAATLARDGGVKALWLTHYSPAMVNPKEFLYVAREIFRESYAGYDRMTRTFVFEQD